MKQALITFSLFFIFAASDAQQTEWFSESEVNRVLWAEMYSPISKIEFVNINTFHPLYYKEDADNRILNEIQTGMQIPILRHFAEIGKGEWETAICFPMSAVLLIDMYETETAPVINNDYRFGWKVTSVFTPVNSEQKFIRNYSLTLVPIFHESTHIGDEFALHGYFNIPDFKRINVSYEAWQVFAGINRPAQNYTPHISAEIGYQRLMPYKKGFYNIDSLEVKGSDVLLSENRDLWLFRIELQQAVNLSRKRDISWFVSAELQRNIKFGYTSDNPEKKSFSLNSYAGILLPVLYSQRALSVHFRYYRGVMPYGQFRDTDGFSLYGFGISFF